MLELLDFFRSYFLGRDIEKHYNYLTGTFREYLRSENYDINDEETGDEEFELSRHEEMNAILAEEKGFCATCYRAPNLISIGSGLLGIAFNEPLFLLGVLAGEGSRYCQRKNFEHQEALNLDRIRELVEGLDDSEEDKYIGKFRDDLEDEGGEDDAQYA